MHHRELAFTLLVGIASCAPEVTGPSSSDEPDALDARFRTEVGRVIRAIWDVAKLAVRVDQAAKVITSGSNIPQVELDAFNKHLPLLRAYLVDRKAHVEGLTK